uniref:Uncharacterized protein n=1 Tax=Salix viminalis TaxID=40686 RepID=A0A6N2MQE7_SALVM
MVLIAERSKERVILVRVRLQIGGGSMGTREVYEQKLRTGNLYHDPTIKPGLGSPRCPRCLSLLNPISNAASERVILVRVRLQIGGGSMGTREVYEQKLRTENLYHDPTIKPGLGFELQNAASERVILVRVRLQIGGGSMGTREVYEQKLRIGNLYHDPTIKPGLSSPRCPRCLSLLNPISVELQNAQAAVILVSEATNWWWVNGIERYTSRN